MADGWLPSTDLASTKWFDQQDDSGEADKICTFAQGLKGEIVEAQGVLNAQGVYSFRDRRNVISRIRDRQVQPTGPKMFTPLAAATFSTNFKVNPFFI
jgi:hypothetical protein